MPKSIKHNQKKRKQTLKRKDKLNLKRGGCGCGNDLILGGSLNLDKLPIHYYYGYNNNPNYLSEQIKGGRRRTNGKAKSAKKRKMKGGNNLLNGLNSFGTVLGISDTYRVVNAIPINNYNELSTNYVTGNIPPV